MSARRAFTGLFLLTASMVAGLPANAEVVVLADTEVVVDQDLYTRTYDFSIPTQGDYLGTLADLGFLEPFYLLAVGITQTGGATLVADQRVPGSFMMQNLAAGPYTAILIAEPGTPASSYSLKVALIPEPGALAMIITGLGLLGWQIRRRHSMMPGI